MTATLGGSYEESPPSLLDFAARDRRWCQGNLQHLALLPARGLHWVSRLHLLTGIGSYLTAPLWFIFLLFGILVSLQAQFVRPEYFPKGFSLFPTWPAQDPILAAWVFVATMGMLILPKMLAYIVMLTHKDERKRFGGSFRAFAGILAETFLSGLTAPVMMIFQSSAVAAILLGHDAGWQVQRRDDGAVSYEDTLRKYSVPTLFGITMAISAYAVSLALLLWMMPVILRLLLAIPLAMLSSSASARSTSCLFKTPEETSPPQVLLRAHALATTLHRTVCCPLLELHRDADLRAAHLNNLSGPKPRNRGEVDPHLAIARAKIEDAETFDEAAAFLTSPEKFAVLNSPAVLGALLALPPSWHGWRKLFGGVQSGLRGGLHGAPCDPLGASARNSISVRLSGPSHFKAKETPAAVRRCRLRGAQTRR
jgi:membrane glycosyltransferase